MTENREASQPTNEHQMCIQLDTAPPSVGVFCPHNRIAFLACVTIAAFAFYPSAPLYRLYLAWALGSIILAARVHDSPFIHPHPFFWRIVLGFTLILSLTFLFLSFVDVSTQKKWLTILTPETAGNVHPDRDYSMSCEIYDRTRPSDPFHNLKVIVFDEFVPAHFFGWIFHAFILRDTKMCWILSIAFEFVERGLKHWFVNFNECWWDSFILDVLLTNGTGIYIGMKIADLIELHAWDTRLYCDCPTYGESIKKAFSHITPRSYKRFDWKPLSSLRRYITYIVTCATLIQMMMMLFTLKMELSMTTMNPLVRVLMFLDAFIGIPAAFELYLYASEQRDTIGHYSSSALLFVIMQTLEAYRCRGNYFTEPTPLAVKIAFFSLITLMIVFPIVWFSIHKKKSKT